MALNYISEAMASSWVWMLTIDNHCLDYNEGICHKIGKYPFFMPIVEKFIK